MTDTTSLRAAEFALQEAQLRSDVEALDALLRDDLTHVGHDGRITAKAVELSDHTTGRVRVDRLEPDDVQARAFGGAGVTLFTGRIWGTLEDQAFQVRVRYTRTWAFEDGGWRLVAAHMTVLGPSTV